MRHSIKTVARRTGLTPHVIRIWERRYKAVEPERTGTNRRSYSDDDIMRLGLLRRATEAGHNIGNVAGLSTEVLVRLAAESAGLAAAPGKKAESSTEIEKRLLDDCVAAIRAMDTRKLEDALSRGALAFGQHGLLERVVAPLTHEIGELWRGGKIMSAHEHFASAAIRSFLGRSSTQFAHETNAPLIVVATPSGQLHELGAVMVAAAASDLGWRVTYLGPSLPASEIAAAVIQNQARAVALSIVYPDDDPKLPVELEVLRRHLPAETALIVGGRAADSYRTALQKSGALVIHDLKAFYAKLEQLRKPSR